MTEQHEYEYYVVEISDRSDVDFDKYVCVPNSWIGMRDTEDQSGQLLVAIRYPLENVTRTKERVKRNERLSNISGNCTILMGYVKYASDLYQDAENFIKSKLMEERYERRQDDDTWSLNKPKHKDEELETLQPQTSLLTDIKEDKNVVSKPEHPFIETNNIINHKLLGQIVKIDNTDEGSTYYTRQARHLAQIIKGEVTTSKTENVFTETNFKTQEKVMSEAIDYIRSTCISTDKETESLNTHNSPEVNIKSQNHQSSEPVFGSEFIPRLNELHNYFEDMHVMFDHLRIAYVQKCTLIKDIIKLVTDYNSSRMHNQILPTEEEDNYENDNEFESKHTQVHMDVDEIDNKNNNAEMVNISPGPTLTLPENFNESDSRWTLKHRKKQPDLVELLPNSGIYVNALNLRKCKRISRNSKMLASLLLEEIFKESALDTCLLTDEFAIDVAKLRSKLDGHALNVLLNFVDHHAEQEKWVKIDTNELQKQFLRKYMT